MYKTFCAILTIIWILDILNIPFTAFLDNEIAVNGLAWLLIWILIPSAAKKSEEESDK